MTAFKWYGHTEARWARYLAGLRTGSGMGEAVAADPALRTCGAAKDSAAVAALAAAACLARLPRSTLRQLDTAALCWVSVVEKA